MAQCFVSPHPYVKLVVEGSSVCQAVAETHQGRLLLPGCGGEACSPAAEGTRLAIGMGGTRSSFYSTVCKPQPSHYSPCVTRMTPTGSVDSSYLQLHRIGVILIHHLVLARWDSPPLLAMMTCLVSPWPE